jgi:hypothetical protein
LGVVVGVVTAVLAHGALTTGEAAPVAPSTTTTTRPPPEWFHPAETLLGPAVLVPEHLGADGGAVWLRYRLEPITPASAGPEDAADTAVLPRSWTLVTDAGEYRATTTPWTREVRFAVPPGVSAGGIRELRIDDIWIRSPFNRQVTVDLDDTPDAVVAPGMSVVVIRTMGGSSGSQAVAAMQASEGFTISELAIESTAGSWITSSMNQGATTRWTLSFTGPIPDPLPLSIRGVAWLRVDSGSVVDLEGVPRA